MLVPTSNVILLSDDPKSESLNTIKVDFSKMSFIKSTQQNFTQCPSCKALLTIEDKKYISFKNTDPEGKFMWSCRFCKQQNKNAQLYFVSSNFKRCIQKNASTKIIPPIILFLIDISGSMTSSIYTDLWRRSQEKDKKSSNLITNQMKKIIEDSVMRKNQAQYLAELQKSFGNPYEFKQQGDKKQNIEHFSKLSFLFAIIEYHLKILKSKKQKTEHRIGFIFFSDSLIVLKGAKQKSIPMYVHQEDQIEEAYPFKKEKLDFNSFEKLFDKGKSYDRYFGDSRFSNFDVTKLSVQYIKTGGKTALGPALAFASGIISQHDQGSKVIMVTDSISNYGILSSKQQLLHYKQIASVFQENKATLGIFRLINNEFQNIKVDQQFQHFIKSNQQFVRLIQVSIFPSITEQVLQNAIKSLRNLINHESVGHSYNLMILNENKKIMLDKFKYDNIDYRSLRFITSQSKNWIQVNIDKKQIEESDMLFPVMTQLVIEYDDIFTKEKCIFMSYIVQRLIKPMMKKQPFVIQSDNSLSKKSDTQHSQQQILQQYNMQNIQTIVDMQFMKRFEDERQNMGFLKKTFRNQLKNNYVKISNGIVVSSIDCQGINDYTLLQNKVLSSGKSQSSKNQKDESLSNQPSEDVESSALSLDASDDQFQSL